ncbi:MAG: hypothetical protein A3A44_00255 [Candidatus Sungbacteria bacterium RIFCSPLOWO2_01_FULL_60_25]|uniref:Uncharacterized protein n=1 Tax=Candidatus Sungbacteria bacterium RIFCSPLOWO2_01_FULL_60_25 TaxID=1802281 RepID=A0A1G2LC60_9BACT|nr:MAG: hypothetical protein A3A44_00255 [Candidatus Sungbacteria bacterium RIFCSPLOWO2_01_FULL_60_25]
MRDTVLMIILIGVLGAIAFASYWFFAGSGAPVPSTYASSVIDPVTLGQYRQLTGVQLNVEFFSRPPFSILEDGIGLVGTSSAPMGRPNPFLPF